jgi:hypothetical protein
LLALALCLLVGAARTQTYDPDIQRRFVEGAAQLQAGDLEGAERTFRQVLEKTNSPRVKLELARTLFLLKRYRESRALFREVLLDTDVPWQVRENVEVFLRRIDEAYGYVRFAASIVSDSNPRNVTSQRQFTIGGFQLTFVPPPDNERVTGMRFAVQALQPIDAVSRLSGYLSGAYVDYPNDTFDRLTLDLGLAKSFDIAGRSVLRGGIETGTFGGRSLYDFPYVAYRRVISDLPRERLTGEVKAGRVNFPHYDYMDAAYGSAALSAVTTVSETVALGLNLKLERSNAREAPYSYTGVALGPSLWRLIDRPAILVTAEVSFGKRDYRAADPLFGQERTDHKTLTEFAVRSRHWRWSNLRPALIVSSEHNRSSIGFYEYEKVNLSLALE